MPPRLLHEAGIGQRRGVHVGFEDRHATTLEEFQGVVKDESLINGSAQTYRRVPIGVEMNLTQTARREVVAETLEFKRGPVPD